MKRLSYHYIAIVICCALTASCQMEIDNYEAPDATIQGVIYDHNGQPLQLNHGAGYIRMREVNWETGDSTVFIGNQTLRVQQDGTYRHTKWFAGEYRMFPSNGNFYPYWAADDTEKDGDNAGELVKISGVTTKDFTVTPYLTIEWVKTPTLTADSCLECTVRFIRNTKEGFEMPDVRDAWLQVSRTVNASAGNNSEYFPSQMTLNNSMEGQEIVFRTVKPLKYYGINYWVRVTMNCQPAAGKPETNYPGMGQANCTTIVMIYVP